MSVFAVMVHGLLIGALLAAGAAACAWGLRARGLPTRGVWAAAAAGTVAIPLVARLDLPALFSGAGGPGAVTALPVSPADPPPVPASEAGAGIPLPPLPGAVDSALGAGWMVASATMLGLLLWSLLRMRRRLREWPRAEVRGTRVRLSRGTGPAAVGLRDPAVVLPRRALEMDPARLRLVLAHEAEHARTRDPALLAAGAFLLALGPWNPALWWIVRRLRGAVELDCDRRVLARGASPAAYGRLLIDLSEERFRPLPAVAALGERRTDLERRILAMTKSRARHPALRLSGGLLAALALVVLACDAPPPTTAPAPDAGAEPRADAIRGTVRPADGGERRVIRFDAGSRPPPLVFVDGVRVEKGSLSDIDPSSIASIQVMKGPIGYERYGSEGEDGVIRIRTKDGASIPDGAAIPDTARAPDGLRNRPAPADGEGSSPGAR